MIKDNIVLIGMPSSGKSTIGARLAEYLKMGFADTDSIISGREKMTPKDIVLSHGLEKFLQIQEAAVLGLNVSKHIIATGGGIVYNKAAMEHLKNLGTVIYLKLPLTEIEKRITPGRRFAREKGQSLEDIFNERTLLYEKYADLTIDCMGKSIDEITWEIAAIFK